MTPTKRLKAVIQEVSNAYKLVRVTKIVDGKKVIKTEKQYKEKCPDGYKRDSTTGKCVKMSPKEQRNRSVAAKKSANKASTKRNKAVSMKRRKSLVKK